MPVNDRYGARFTDEGYASEIAAHPPALIVTVGGGFNLPAILEAASLARRRGAGRRCGVENDRIP